MSLFRKATIALLPLALCISCEQEYPGEFPGTTLSPNDIQDEGVSAVEKAITDLSDTVKVSLEEARLSADTMAARQSVTEGREITVCNVEPIEYKGEVVQYVAEFCDSGYMILSAAKDEPPLMMMTFRGRYSNHTDHWLVMRYKKLSYYSMAQKGHFEIKDLDLNEYNFYTYKGDFRKDIDSHRATWTKFLRGDREIVPYNGTGGNPTFRANMNTYGPLLTSSWGQNGYGNSQVYNYYTPEDCGYTANKPCPTGCAATAASQLMYYWQWPEYYDGATYDYGRMFDTTYAIYRSIHYSDPVASKEVPKLIRDVGSDMVMQYHGAGSWPLEVNNVNDTMHNFGYKSEDTDINMGITAPFGAWRDRAIVDIGRNSPLLVAFYDSSSTANHVVVVDGYDITNASAAHPHAHVNLGWEETIYDAFDEPNPNLNYTELLSSGVWIYFGDAHFNGGDMDHAYSYYMVENVMPRVSYYTTKKQGVILCNGGNINAPDNTNCLGMKTNYNSLRMFDDMMSNTTDSVKVFNGWRVMLCENEDYTGRCQFLVAEDGTADQILDSTKLTAMSLRNDLASIQVDKPGLVFCTGAHRSGWCSQTQASITDLAQWATPRPPYTYYQTPEAAGKYNDRISWMKLSRGWKMTVYLDAGYSPSNTSMPFTDPQAGSTSNGIFSPDPTDDGLIIDLALLFPNQNDKISSIKLQEPVTFCTEDLPPSGDCYTMQPATPTATFDLTKLTGWNTAETYNDRISWIKIPQGLAITICDATGLGTGGAGCRGFNAFYDKIILNATSLQSYGLNEKISSIQINTAVRPITPIPPL